MAFDPINFPAFNARAAVLVEAAAVTFAAVAADFINIGIICHIKFSPYLIHFS
jgi:hypothetical protein